MLKNLLYLYNDGHNPFPNMRGYGGLGYHLPEYHKVIHGGSLTPENIKLKELLKNLDDINEGAGGGGKTKDELTKEIYDLVSKENEDLVKQKEQEIKTPNTQLEVDDGGGGGGYTDEQRKQVKGKKNNVIPIEESDSDEEPEPEPESNDIEIQKENLKKEIEGMTVKSIKEELDKLDISYPSSGKLKPYYVELLLNQKISVYDKKASKSTPEEINVVEEVIPIMKEVEKLKADKPDKIIKEKKKTKAEIKAEQDDIKFAITENLFSRGKKNNKDNKIVANSILENLPQLSKEEFNNDPEKYLNMYYNKKFEKSDKMEAIKKAVTEEHGQGETETQGHAAEIVFLRDHQDILKELVGSTDPEDIIMPSSESEGFKNKQTGEVPLSWNGKPISHYSLFDADGKNSSIDLKYYDSKNADIQFTKICGSNGFTPLYHEVDGKLKLYNVRCEETGRYINRYPNTDTFIISINKKTGDIKQWNMTNFIQKNIRDDEYDVSPRNKQGLIFKTPKEEFISRMIQEGKLKPPKSHTKESEKGKWFCVNMEKINKK